EPPSAAGPDQAAALAELAAEVRALAAGLATLGAEVVAGDIAMAEIDRQHETLKAALLAQRARNAEAAELLLWATAAGELAGEQFATVVNARLAAGREPTAWIRRLARLCRQEQRRGRPVRPPMLAKVLNAKARELLAEVGTER